jgi:hypothetical protein
VHPSVSQSEPLLIFSFCVKLSLSLIWARAVCTCCTRGCFDDNNTSSSLSLSPAPSCAQPAPLLFTAPACKSTLPSACACSFKTCSVHNMILWHGRKWSSAQHFSNSMQTGREFLVNQAHYSQGGSALSSLLFFTFYIYTI